MIACMSGVALLSVAALTLTGCDMSTSTADRRAHDTMEHRIAISTSSWDRGDGGRRALIGGALQTAKNGCPYLSSGQRLWVIWPEGFGARLDRLGRVLITGPDGAVVAREDDYVQAGGALGGGPARPNMACIPDGTEITVIESEINVLSPDSR